MSLDVCIKDEEGNELYTSNITHNLSKMAGACVCYRVLWQPEELGYNKAWELIPEVEQGLIKLVLAPSYYKQYNSPNGFGVYEDFVSFMSGYLEALKKYPDGYLYDCR